VRRFSRILVYTEVADATALAQVVELAATHDASVSVCDVVPHAPALPDPTGTLSHLEELNVRFAFERLRTLCAPYANRIDLDYTVLTGVPFLAITEQVMLQDFDLVVHVCEPEDGVGLNPTGMHLMRKCPAAVWSLSPEYAAPPASILLAVDRRVDATGASTKKMAHAQVTAAAALTSGRDVRLHVVHAWQPYGEELLDHPRSGLTPDVVDTYVDVHRQNHEEWLSDLADELSRIAPQCTIETHLERGAAVDVIHRIADDIAAELIVMGTIGTSTVPGVLIGTSAEGILAHSRIPVLALKPRGFATPLQFTNAATQHVSSEASG